MNQNLELPPQCRSWSIFLAALLLLGPGSSHGHLERVEVEVWFLVGAVHISGGVGGQGLALVVQHQVAIHVLHGEHLAGEGDDLS